MEQFYSRVIPLEVAGFKLNGLQPEESCGLGPLDMEWV
jgi:hypothetical protein